MSVEYLNLRFELLNQMAMAIRMRDNWLIGDIGIRVEDELDALLKTTQKSALPGISKELGEKPGTTRQRVWVSRSFPDKTQRDRLPWSFYRAVASSENVTDPMAWIKRAQDEGWTLQVLEAKLQMDNKRRRIRAGKCKQCGDDLYTDTVRHVSFQGKKEGDFCSRRCIANYYGDS